MKKVIKIDWADKLMELVNETVEKMELTTADMVVPPKLRDRDGLPIASSVVELALARFARDGERNRYSLDQWYTWKAFYMNIREGTSEHGFALYISETGLAAIEKISKFAPTKKELPRLYWGAHLNLPFVIAAAFQHYKKL